MKPEYFFSTIAAIIGLQAVPSAAADLVVVVNKIPDDSGTIKIAVCRQNEFLHSSCDYHDQIASKSPRIATTIRNIPPGIYAIQAFQDRNTNNRLDRSFIGIPREPIGFSRNPTLRFGPPKFEQCAIQITAAGGEASLDLITR